MFDIALLVLVIIHSSMIGLGIGASTIAITGFVTALMDGEFDASERRIMGVVYLSLRIAMVGIVLSSLAVWLLQSDSFGTVTAPMWILVGVLFVNAFLMTKHLISMKLGPAIQAGTWYSLGFFITVYVFDLAAITLTGFLIAYVLVLIAAVVIVELFMQYFRRKRISDGQDQSLSDSIGKYHPQ